MNKIAIIFPGMGYGKDKPLLYYSAKQAKELGYEIRYTDYEGLPQMAADTRQAKVEWLDQAYEKVVEQLSDIDWSCKDIVFIAKSVGTIIASKYANDHDLKPVMILLTPLNETFEFLCDGKNYIFTGRKDPLIDHDALSGVFGNKAEGVYVYDDANHSLECGSVEGNLEILCDCIRHVRATLEG